MDNADIQPQLEVSPSVANCRPGDSSKPSESSAPCTPPPLGGVGGRHFERSTPGDPPNPRSVAHPTTHSWPTRCAYCGSNTNPQPCCVHHPTTPMCDWCRNVPRRLENHRPPLEADPGPTATCAVCELTLPISATWPWTGPGRRICIPCLRKVDEF